MPLIARQRSRLAVLAVLALVGSLLAGSAVLVAAKDGEADNKAQYSACVGAATDDAGFTDMAGSFAENAANCLAHYEITIGTGDGTTFSPNATITRLQMALFLARAAGPAGIQLPVASDQGFTDIEGHKAEIQVAINQVAELGIMTGRSDEMFEPSGMVSRQDMALHLAAFLGKALLGPGGTDIDKVKPDDTVFTDIGDVAHSAYGAIRQLYELGVTEGTGDGTTFSPDALVSRGQMAQFIKRALAHTNARPAGLSVQASTTAALLGDTVEFMASVRDGSHMPVANASVDFFYLVGDDDKPFKADGSCTSDVVRLRGTDECEIDAGDLKTDSRGNFRSPAMLAPTGDTRVWAWTGDLGDEFDEDTTDSVPFSISVGSRAANTRFTNSSATGTVKFGEPVTPTFQLVDDDGDEVAAAGKKVTVTSTLTIRKGSVVQSSETRTKTYETDSSGRIELPAFTAADPDTDDKSNDRATLTLTVTLPSTDRVPSGLVDAKGNSVGRTMTVVWDDDEPVATTLTLSLSEKYHVASNEGKGVRNIVEATVRDQYGDPVDRADVDFWSNDSNGVGTTRRTIATGSGGVASYSYFRDTAANGTERIYASHAAITGATSINHYWVKFAAAGTGDVLLADTDGNTIVVNARSGGSTGPVYVEYDGNDQFTSDGDREVLADFEKDLTRGLKMDDDTRYNLSLDWEIALDAGARDADGVSELMLTLVDLQAPVPPTPDTTAPVFDSATTSGDGKSIVLTYERTDEPGDVGEALDDDHEPAVDSFRLDVTVKPGTPDETVRRITIADVDVSGTTVTLTVHPVESPDEAAVQDIDERVEVSYTPPTSDALQDAAGNRARSLTDRPVANVVDITAPMLITDADSDNRPQTSFGGMERPGTTTTLTGVMITLTYDEALDENSVPDSSAFTVRATGDARTRAVSNVNVDGMKVELTISQQLSERDRPILVDYTPPATGAVQDLAGNAAEALSDVTVWNRIDTTRPVLGTVNHDDDDGTTPEVEGALVSADGRTITLTYTDSGSGLDQGSVPNTESFQVWVPAAADMITVNATSGVSTRPATALRAVYPTEVNVDGNMVELTLAPEHRLVNGDTAAYATSGSEIRGTTADGDGIGVRYTVESLVDNVSGVIQDRAGNDAEEESHISVYTRTVDSAPPVLVTAAVSADGRSITLTFRDGLADPTSTDDDEGSGLAQNVRPSVGAFSIAIDPDGSSSRTVQPIGISVDGNVVTLTLSASDRLTVASPTTFTVAYDKDAALDDPLRDVVGNEVLDIDATTVVVTGLDLTGPTQLSVDPDGNGPGTAGLAHVLADGVTIRMWFGEQLDLSAVPVADAFSVAIGTATVTPESVSLHNDDSPTIGVVTLTLPSANRVTSGATVTVSYTVPNVGSKLQDQIGNAAAAITDSAVNVTLVT